MTGSVSSGDVAILNKAKQKATFWDRYLLECSFEIRYLLEDVECKHDIEGVAFSRQVRVVCLFDLELTVVKVRLGMLASCIDCCSSPIHGENVPAWIRSQLRCCRK